MCILHQSLDHCTNPLVKPPNGRADSSTPAMQVEPQTHAKAGTRAVHSNPVQVPNKAAPGSPASGYGKAPDSSLGSRLTSLDLSRLSSRGALELLVRSRMAGGMTTKAAHATGQAPQPKAQVILHPHCMHHIICRAECCHKWQQTLTLQSDLMCSTH